MAHSTDQHLEHAEHVQHQAHNPFDRRVAMTMSIMAALLAGVTLASHRGHTETLRLANESTTFHTKANDQWSLYQAKNIRSHEYQAFLLLEGMLAPEALRQDDDAKANRNYLVKQVDKFEGEGYWKKFSEGLKNPGKAKAESASQETEAPESKSPGHGAESKPKAAKSGEREVLKKEAEELQEKAKASEEQSHKLHETVTSIDLGHLGLELALVFCAVAVLTKQKSFWLIGMVLGLVGAGVAGYGIYAWRLLEMATPLGHH
jgi:hypothetical protein